MITGGDGANPNFRLDAARSEPYLRIEREGRCGRRLLDLPISTMKTFFSFHAQPAFGGFAGLAFQAPEAAAVGRVVPAGAVGMPLRRGWRDRFDRWCARQAQAPDERYLAAAADVFALEERMRVLARADSRSLL